MSKQILAGAKKNFWSLLTFSLAGYPAACKMANINLFAELFCEKTVLVFGTYDIVFLIQKKNRSGLNSPEFNVSTVTRAFSEKIPLTGAWVSRAPHGNVDVRAGFSREPRVHVRPGRRTSLKLGDFFKSLFFRRACVEIQVESEIAVEILPAENSAPETAPAGLPEKKRGDAAGEGNSSGLDVLAEQVARILSLGEEKKGKFRVFARQEAGGEARRPGAVSPDAMKISGRDYEKMDPGRIPSRPGLAGAFVQDAPPPRPPGKGG